MFRDKARAQRLARSALPGVFGVVVVPGLSNICGCFRLNAGASIIHF